MSHHLFGLFSPLRRRQVQKSQLLVHRHHHHGHVLLRIHLEKGLVPLEGDRRKRTRGGLLQVAVRIEHRGQLPVGLAPFVVNGRVRQDVHVDVVERMKIVAAKLRARKVKNLVVDPVMISKSGSVLLKPDAIERLKDDLIPLATLVTPNIREAEKMAQMPIASLDDAKKAARKIRQLGCRAVLVKGGHLAAAPATDLLYDGKRFIVLPGEFI